MGAEWRPVTRSSSTPVSLGRPSEGTGNSGLAVHDPNANSAANSRWYEPTPAPQPRTDKIFLPSQEIRHIIARTVGSKLSEDFRLFLGDNEYYLPPFTDAREIISNSGLSRASYMPETFDCDDFAMVLKAHFCEAAYRDFERRPPHCVGMIWGELPHIHAINWMINDDYRFRLIEPQTGEIFEPTTQHKNITFMLA